MHTNVLLSSLGTWLYKEHHHMHVLENFTGDNVTSWIKLSFLNFFCQLSFIKLSILTDYSSTFDASINRGCLKVFFTFLYSTQTSLFFEIYIFYPQSGWIQLIWWYFIRLWMHVIISINLTIYQETFVHKRWSPR